MYKRQAQNGEGIDDLVAAIGRHREHLDTSGEIDIRRRKILQMRILKAAEDIVRSRLLGEGGDRLSGLLEQAMAGEIDPYGAAGDLLAALE